MKHRQTRHLQFVNLSKGCLGLVLQFARNTGVPHFCHVCDLGKAVCVTLPCGILLHARLTVSELLHRDRDSVLVSKTKVTVASPNDGTSAIQGGKAGPSARVLSNSGGPVRPGGGGRPAEPPGAGGGAGQEESLDDGTSKSTPIMERQGIELLKCYTPRY